MPPEQKNPDAQPVLAALTVQAVAHAVVEPHAKGLQLCATPAVHETPLHVPAGVNTPVAVAHEAALQLTPQEPQFWGVLSDDSQPAAVVQSPNPVLQVCTHVPVVQLPVAPGALVHGVLHTPQLVLVRMLVSQPRFPLPEQCPKPVAHDAVGMEQTPSLHCTEAPALTFGSEPQLKPHDPQFSGSFWRSTHLVVQRSGAGETQLDEHVGAPVVVEQSAVGATQLLVQLPQVAGVLRFVSQPRSGLPPQWANPETHDVGGMEQTPERHWTVAPDLTLGSAPQLWPQDPQFAPSELKSTQRDPHRLGDGATQLDEQAGAPVVVEQRPVGATQAVPHLPQLVMVERLVSQPSSGSVEQWANPVVQALGGT